MSVTIPEFITAEGNVKAVFIPTLTSTSAPSIAELNGATAVDISCFLMPDWDGPTATQNTGDDRRFCSTRTFDILGRVKWEIAPLMYTYLPQELGTPGHAANEVYEALAEGNSGYLVIRHGADAAGTFVVGDVVDVFPVDCGVKSKSVRGADEFAPATVTQRLSVSGVEALDSACAV